MDTFMMSDTRGTVAYKAPELLRGYPATASADLYSFGVLVWQMMSRKHPYSTKVCALLLLLLIYSAVFMILDQGEDEIITLAHCLLINACGYFV